MRIVISSHRRLDQRGLALVEFALVLPLLSMLLIGLIEIGRLTYFSIEVGNAAHAGAFYGASDPTHTTGGMVSAARADAVNISTQTPTANYVYACWNAATQTSTPATPSPTHTTCSSGGNSVTYAQVSVTGTIRTLFNYGSSFGLPTSWTVTRTATMRVAQ
jgi:Flp pilus assembly protein TadG